MNKPRERIILLAIVLGVVAVSMMIWVIKSSTAPPASAETQVVTAASNIPSGMPVTEADLSIRSFKNNEVPPDAATSKALVIGKVAKSNILAGQAILLSSVMTSAEAGYPHLLPPFMRAVTVGLDPVSGVAGFLKPGDHVDVVATFEMNSTSYAKTVLQNVLLFAIGSQAIDGGDKPASDKQTARVETTATLVVTPSDAEKLILADAKGKLRLTLRSYNDNGTAPRRPIGTDVALGVKFQSSQTAARPAPAANRGFTGPAIGPLPVFPSQFGSNSTGTPAAVVSGKTIVIVRGSTTSETVVPE